MSQANPPSRTVAALIWHFYAVILLSSVATSSGGGFRSSPQYWLLAIFCVVCAIGIFARYSRLYYAAYAPLVALPTLIVFRWDRWPYFEILGRPLAALLWRSFTTTELLDRPAKFFNWWDVPQDFTRVALCLAALILLAVMHRTLIRTGYFSSELHAASWQRLLRLSARLSLAVVVVSLVIIAAALVMDPPGPSAPGGPGGGLLPFIAFIYVAPWAVVGAVGLLASQLLLRRKRNDEHETS